MDKLTFSIKNGLLTWGTHVFDAKTGGFGKGPLPVGLYTVRKFDVVVGFHLPSGYLDVLSKNRWFIPLEPEFQTDRDGFGIHPDGPPMGTKGCIGLTGVSCGNFWNLWTSKAIIDRPRQLQVMLYLK